MARAILAGWRLLGQFRSAAAGRRIFCAGPMGECGPDLAANAEAARLRSGGALARCSRQAFLVVCPGTRGVRRLMPANHPAVAALLAGLTASRPGCAWHGRPPAKLGLPFP